MNVESFKDKNILITGINGFVGSSLARFLVYLGANVTGLVHTRSKNHIPILDRCNIVEGDICDFDTVRETLSRFEIEYVFHFAAYAIVRVSSRDPVSAYRINVMGTVNLLEACRSVGTVKKIIVASSDKAYGDHENLPYTESHDLRPRNTYDTSKACMDMISRSYAHNYNMPIVVTRCSNIYGPGDMNTSRLIPNTIRRILHGYKPLVYSDVDSMEREFIYIDDVVLAYACLAEQPIDSVLFYGDAFNIGGTGVSKIHDVVALISKKMGGDGSVEVVSRDNVFKEIQSQWIDASKMKECFGWEAQTSLELGIEKTIEWYTNFFKTGEYY